MEGKNDKVRIYANLIDFIKSFWIFYFQKKQNRLPPFFGTFFFLCFLIAAAGKHDICLGTESYYIPLLAVLLSLFLIFGPFIFNLWLSYLIIKGEKFNQPVQFIAENEQISIQDKDAFNKWNWGVFIKKIESRNYFILVSDQIPENFFFIPKRVFSSTEEIKAFKKLLETKILPEARKASTLKAKSPINNSVLASKWIIIGILLIAVLINVLLNYK